MKTKRRKSKRGDAVSPSCPWCGEPFEVWVDEGAGAHQRYVEDCAVCCHPCVVTVEPGDALDAAWSADAPDALEPAPRVSVERE